LSIFLKQFYQDIIKNNFTYFSQGLLLHWRLYPMAQK